MSLAMVAQLVPSKEMRNHPEARAAINKEWDNLKARDCWDMSEAKPWSEVRKDALAKGETVHLGSLLELC